VLRLLVWWHPPSASFCTDKKMSFRPPSPATKLVGTVHQVGSGVDPAIAIGRKVSWSPPWLAWREVASTASENNIILRQLHPRWGTTTPADSPSMFKIPAAVAQGKSFRGSAGHGPGALPRLVEPLSCCLNGEEYLNAQPGDRALVFGAAPSDDARRYPQGPRLQPVIVTDVLRRTLGLRRGIWLGPVRQHGRGQWHREDTRGRWGREVRRCPHRQTP